MSLGLDTSVVLRLLTGQPPKEALTARKRLERAVESNEDVHVTDLVLGETYFALQYHYGLPKEDARRGLLEMLKSGIVRASPAEALAALEPSKGAGVMDRLIHERHGHLGCVTLTFDRKMAALEGAVRLGPA